MPGTGRAGGGTRGGAVGGGATGADPYKPGENSKLKWITRGTIDQALTREEGSTRPALVFLYSPAMREDCCAANFERAVFRYKRVVDFSKNFTCYKLSMPTYKASRHLRRFKLEDKKPVILLLDAEGGLLHSQQRCIDPGAYLKILKRAYALNDKRVRLKEKYLGLRRDARGKIEDGDYSKALKLIDNLLKKRNQLSGHVLALVEEDRAEIERIGNDLFEQATRLRGEERFLEAYRLFKEVQKEFSRLQDVSKEARSCARELASELRKRGISTH